ncbi:DUF4294 domain-containing protein [Parabacteroides sp. Marseille-P3160]|uniref:DUF4294 domain-containing protein n=1 Tax=Parabacteroides sp. Marseille-P3160 TaxID=1917887 RepID=UPI0009BB21DB|nr:DUF4294 domain-containing protein [Parabacteroides sp. Marseille-P3160]
MNRYKFWLIVSFLICFLSSGKAQEGILTYSAPLPYKLYLLNGKDTVPVFTLPTAFVFGEYRFKSKKQEQQYTKLVRDVKRTLPYAKMVYATLIETYEYMETLPDEKSKQAHLKRMEKELYKEYKPQLKKLSYSQGKLLIKLIDRECNQSSYNILNAYLGSFRAGFWNLFAGVFGASLKTEYDPGNKDRQVEMIVRLVEDGSI